MTSIIFIKQYITFWRCISSRACLASAAFFAKDSLLTLFLRLSCCGVICPCCFEVLGCAVASKHSFFESLFLIVLLCERRFCSSSYASEMRSSSTIKNYIEK